MHLIEREGAPGIGDLWDALTASQVAGDLTCRTATRPNHYVDRPLAPKQLTHCLQPLLCAAARIGPAVTNYRDTPVVKTPAIKTI